MFSTATPGESDRARAISLFVSSPGDVLSERDAVTRVVHRLNDEQRGLLNLRDIRWENAYYGAHQTFQSQIVEAESCDLVICILWRRLGSELPADFPKRMKNGKPYPSGTVYELMTALAARDAHSTPDVWVYKKGQAVADAIADVGEMEKRLRQWQALDEFWKDFFQNAQGQFTAAYKPFDLVEEFEATFEKNLRDWLADKGLLQARPSWPLAEKGPPFRGLEAFDVEHERIMFGRQRLAERAVEAVQRDLANKSAYLLLIGESGAGKSSLARAAVLPRILRLTGETVGRADVWRVARLVVSASESPFVLLADVLFGTEALPELVQSDSPRPATLASALRGAGAGAVGPITRALERVAEQFRKREGFDRPATARLALLIDQLESLFAASPDVQAAFAALIKDLVATGFVVVVATLRADRYEDYCRVDGLLALKGAGTTLDVPMPGLAEIADIVRGPAGAAGLAFEGDGETGESLDETLIKATAGRDALPLLQFTLEKLYEAMTARLAAGGIGLAAAQPTALLLRCRDYVALGGLEGAISLVADSCFQALDPDARAALPRLVRALVRGVATGATAETALESDLPGGEASARLVHALLARRILVAGVRPAKGAKPETTIRFAHEAVIRGWRVVREQIAADENFYRIREEVAAAQRRWKDSGETVDRLIAPGLPLAEAESLVRDFREELPGELFAYVEASSAREAARRDKELAEARRREEDAYRLAAEQGKVAEAQRQVARRTRIGLVAALVCALAAVAGAFAALSEKTTAEVAKAEALAREVDARHNQAAALAASSSAAISTSPTRATKLALAAWPRQAESRTPKLDVTIAALGAAVTALRERKIFRHEDYVRGAAFSPDGSRVVTASNDKTARVWDATTGATVAVLRGHDDAVVSAVFSADGSRVLTASDDNTARVWDANTGEQLAVARGNDEKDDSGFLKSTFFKAAFSPDGRRFVTASRNATAEIWDAQTGRQLAVLRGHDGPVLTAAFSPDGKRVVTASGYTIRQGDKTARVWDAATGRPLAVLRGHGDDLTGAVFSPDGSRILTSSADRTARLWDAATGRQVAVLSGHEGSVRGAAFSADGKRIVTASADSTARLWDAATGRSTAVLRGHRGEVVDAVFSRDGKRVVTASEDKTARLWYAASGMPITVLDGHEGWLTCATFSPDGARALTASNDKTARLWDVVTATATTLRGSDGLVTAAAFSQDGTRVIVTSEDGSARLWSTVSGAQVAALNVTKETTGSAAISQDGTRLLARVDKGVRVWDAATGNAVSFMPIAKDLSSTINPLFSPDASRVITSFGSATAAVWDAATGKQITLLRGHDGELKSAAFSPDGTRAVTASADMTARVWDPATGTVIAVLRGHTGEVFDAAFSPDGTRVITRASEDGSRLWDAATGAALGRFGEPPAFSPDGKRFAFASNSGMSLWDTATGKQIRILSRDQGKVLAYSPDGSRIVVADANSNDTIARLLDTTTGGQIATLRGHAGSIESAAFSQDGARIVTVSRDLTARLWDAATGSAIAVLASDKALNSGAFAPNKSGDITITDESLNIYTAAFSPDGTHVVTIFSDTAAWVWNVDMPAGNVFAIACAELPDWNLADIANDYGLTNLEPICGHDVPLPDPAAGSR